MTRLLGCPLTDDILRQWVRHMVSPRAPFYLADDDRHLPPAAVVPLTRAELAADYVDLPLEARDSYATYGVDHAGAWAVLLDDRTLDDLSPAGRRALLRAQWRLGRGQIYDRDVARGLCAGSALAVAALDPWTFDTEGGDRVSLQHRAWRAFPEEVRRRWLHWFVSRERADCISSSLGAEDWAAMDRRYRDTVRRLAGTFLPRSGPNCFSTTLAAVTPGAPQAEVVSRLWLHQPPFLRALDALGTQMRHGHVLVHILPVDAHALPDQSPMRPLLRRRVEQARDPRQRDADLTVIDQPDIHPRPAEAHIHSAVVACRSGHAL